MQRKLGRLIYGGIIINDLRDGYIRVNNDIVLKTMENEINNNKDGVQRLELRVYLALTSHSTLCGNHKDAIKTLGIKEYSEGGKQYPYLYCHRSSQYVVDLIREDLHAGLTGREKNKKNCEIELCLLKLQRDGFIFATEDRYYIPIYNKYTQIPVDVYEKMLEYFKLNKNNIKSPGRNYYAWAAVAIFKHLYFSEHGRAETCFLGDKTSNGITETQFLTSQETLWENIDEFLNYVGLDHVSEPSSAEGVFFTKQHFGFLGSDELAAIRKKIQETSGTWQGPYDGYYKNVVAEEWQGVVKKPENSLPPVENTVTVDVQELKDEVVSDYCDMSLVNDVIGELFDEQEEQVVDWSADEIPEIDDIDFEEAVTEAEGFIDDGDLIGRGPIQIDDYQLTESEQAYFDVNNPTQKASWMVWMSDEEFAQTRLCALRREKIKSAKKHGVELIVDVPIYTAEEEAILGSADKDMIAKVVAEKEQEAVDKERVAKEQEKKRNQMATKVVNWHLKEEKKTMEDDIFD